MSNTVQIIESLQQEIHRALGPLVPASGKFALLDFPNHSNVGDSAIWLGEIEYFKNWHKMRPAFVSNFARHSTQQLKKALPEGTIFIHGGGNFGDLWTHHQDFREKILQEFPDRKVVQLPQSLHFETAERLKQAQSIINAHPDFTLLVRDHKSHAFAREHFNCTVILCPDMAFALGPQKTPVKAEDKPLFLLRMDKERSHDSVGTVRDVKGAYRLEDWLDEEENLNPKILKQTLAVLPFQLGFRMLNRNAARAAFYNRLAQHRVTRGLRQLSLANFVVTDRLHSHILSLLLDKPHIALDNSYGKLSNFIAAWTSEASNAQSFSKLNDAVAFYNENIYRQGANAPALKKAA